VRCAAVVRLRGRQHGAAVWRAEAGARAEEEHAEGAGSGSAAKFEPCDTTHQGRHARRRRACAFVYANHTACKSHKRMLRGRCESVRGAQPVSPSPLPQRPASARCVLAPPRLPQLK
jgi:hypothetical protein